MSLGFELTFGLLVFLTKFLNDIALLSHLFFETAVQTLFLEHFFFGSLGSLQCLLLVYAFFFELKL